MVSALYLCDVCRTWSQWRRQDSKQPCHSFPVTIGRSCFVDVTAVNCRVWPFQFSRHRTSGCVSKSDVSSGANYTELEYSTYRDL